jgi:hypothetical protein
MPILVKCSSPGCGQALRVNEDLGGKKVRCPKCKTIFTLPASAKAPAAKGSPAKPAPALRKPARDDDDTPPIKAVKRAPAYEDEDDRPAKKTKPTRARDEEDDDRPAKKPAKKAKANDVPSTLWEDCDLLRRDRLMSQVKFSLWGSRFLLYDGDTDEEVGLAAEKLPVWKGLLRPIRLGPVSFRDWMSVDVDVRESADGPVLFTIRKLASPMPWQLTSTIQILDFRKRLVGYFKTKLFSFTGGFWLYDADNEKVAELRGKLLPSSRHLDFLSADGHELGCITSRKMGGLFSTPCLMIDLTDEARDDLRTKVLLLAATMAMGLGGAGLRLGVSVGEDDEEVLERDDGDGDDE